MSKKLTRDESEIVLNNIIYGILYLGTMDEIKNTLFYKQRYFNILFVRALKYSAIEFHFHAKESYTCQVTQLEISIFVTSAEIEVILV